MMVHQGDFYLNEIEESGPAPAKLTLTFNPTNLLSQYKEAKTRTWDNKTIGDIASQIALENGVTPRIDTNLKDIVIDHIDQIRQTDVHFLSNMLRNYKGILKLTSRLLVVATRQSLSSITGIPLNTVLIDLSSVKSYTATTQMASEYSGVKVYVKNTDTAETEEILVGEETNNDKTKDKAVTVIRTPFANRTEATKAGQTKLNSLKRKKQTSLKKVQKSIDTGCSPNEIKKNFENAINTLTREFIVKLSYPGCLGQIFSWNSYLSQ
jgi:phage protein D